ncbi:DegT/DnrJ/EryC1/StrS family aminotransferase [Paenibacillus sp. GCM10027626]|uniref:DegT/DnrJ/EryC1/StrS family aminotransferase n=1 Tax=Paenibacillus sp. GCM10027626 TaxID=3273411 RepID=UPI00362939AC
MDEYKLAIHGGEKIKTTPYSTGKRFGAEEMAQLAEALEQNTLFYHYGSKVKQFLQHFNDLYGVRHSVATSSGTAAIHVALGACGITVGDEVITSPITDQGSIIGILYQNAIPVFADLDPYTYNMDPQSIEACITSRTKAIVAVHLAGNPCDMDPIMDIARRHGLRVIEDCAQSYMTWYKGRLAGTIGDYGCFSTNDFKHISTGDGGIVTVNSGDEADYYRTHAFADKNYQRFGANVVRDLTYLAPNYRMTELQGAVGIAQLQKLPQICRQRHDHGERITEGIRDVPGILPHRITDGGWSSYWFYMLRVDEAVLNCSRSEFAQALTAEGIASNAGYIPQPVYMHPLFQRQQAYIGSRFPFELSNADYAEGLCPTAERILQTAITVPVNEFFSERDIDDVIRGIRKVALHYAGKGNERS